MTTKTFAGRVAIAPFPVEIVQKKGSEPTEEAPVEAKPKWKKTQQGELREVVTLFDCDQWRAGTKLYVLGECNLQPWAQKRHRLGGTEFVLMPIDPAFIVLIEEADVLKDTIEDQISIQKAQSVTLEDFNLAKELDKLKTALESGDYDLTPGTLTQQSGVRLNDSKIIVGGPQRPGELKFK